MHTGGVVVGGASSTWALGQTSGGPCPRAKRPRGKWCQNHSRRRFLYGHPLGRALNRTDIARWRTTFAAFMERHEDTSPQIQVAVEWFDHTLVHHGSSGYGRVHGQEVRRLLERVRGEGVTGRDCLESCGGIWLLASHEPSLLQDDERLTWALATNGVYGSITRPYRTTWTSGHAVKRYIAPSATIRRVLGLEIRSVLGLFFARATQTLNQEVAQLQDRQRVLALPFSPATINATKRKASLSS